MFLHYVYTILFFLFCGLLIKQKRVVSGLILGVLLAFILPPLHKFFATVGADSLMELQKFELEEAVFYLSTVYQTFNFYFRLERFVYYLIIFIIIILVLKIDHPQVAKIASYRLRVLLTAMLLFIFNEFAHFQLNSLIYYQANKNFHIPQSISIEKSHNNLSTVVYIGESSSAYNFSLYDYPQNNSPFLDHLFTKNKLLRFDSIANHTHTTPSLLSALSIQKANQAKPNEVYKQQRIPVTDVLSTAGVSVDLISNQGKGSTVNLASKVMFKHSTNIFSQDVAMVGDRDTRLDKPLDYDFLIPNFKKIINKESSSRSIFLHSYSGHGPYKKYIPENYLENKHFLDDFQASTIFKDTENKTQVLSDLKVYDQTIAYIDSNIRSVIELIDQQKNPMVFVYFSDHGDNAFDGTGHDSRLMDITMLNVPFIIYFNDAARIQFADKWDYLKTISSKKHLITNDWISRLLVYLHGINISSSKTGEYDWTVDNLMSPYVGFRETNSGTTYVPTDVKKYTKEMKVNPQIGGFIQHRTDSSDSTYCLHQSNDIISIIKGLRQTGCIEFDIVFEDEEMFVYHPPMPKTNLTLDNVFDLINPQNETQLWLDGKNINDLAACQFLEKKITSQKKINPHNILVEFPSHTKFSDDLNNKCLNQLKQTGVNISYYIDTHEAQSCGDQDSFECIQFKNKVNGLISNQLITDLSYDKSVLEIMLELNFANIYHNSWSFKSHELDMYKKYNLKRSIYQNNYL